MGWFGLGPSPQKKVEKNGGKQMSFIYHNLLSFTLQSEASRNDRCASVFFKPGFVPTK